MIESEQIQSKKFEDYLVSENGEDLFRKTQKVYEILKHKVEHCVEPINIPEESIIIIGLLHDICKTNFYKVDYRNAKNALGVWEKVPYYTIDDTIP